MKQSLQKPMFIFWLVKTNPSWLALQPFGEGGRFEYVEKVLKPIIGKHRGDLTPEFRIS